MGSTFCPVLIPCKTTKPGSEKNSVVQQNQRAVSPVMFLDGFVRYVTEFVSEERRPHFNSYDPGNTGDTLPLLTHSVIYGAQILRVTQQWISLEH